MKNQKVKMTKINKMTKMNKMKKSKSQNDDDPLIYDIKKMDHYIYNLYNNGKIKKSKSYI